MAMIRYWAPAALVLLAGFLTVDRPAAAAEVRSQDAAVRTAGPWDASAQSRRRRPPTRIIVHPRRYSYPGGYLDPRAVRHCTSWLEPEHRPSGTVIVPRMRCWWAGG